MTAAYASKENGFTIPKIHLHFNIVAKMWRQPRRILIKWVKKPSYNYICIILYIQFKYYSAHKNNESLSFLVTQIYLHYLLNKRSQAQKKVTFSQLSEETSSDHTK